jgi:hypothetical protein
MASREWQEQFRKECIEDRDKYLKWAGMLEEGVFHLHHNNVDISADWAKRNRQIAQEMDDLIQMIDADLRTEGQS